MTGDELSRLLGRMEANIENILKTQQEQRDDMLKMQQERKDDMNFLRDKVEKLEINAARTGGVAGTFSAVGITLFCEAIKSQMKGWGS